MSCGKVASRTPGLGAMSMKVDEMKKFIQSHGTDAAKSALRAIKGAPSRDELCAIFHTFKAGRDEIRKGVGHWAVKSPNASSSSGSASTSSSASSRRSSSSSSSGGSSGARRALRGSLTAQRLRMLRMRRAFQSLKKPEPVFRGQYRKVMQGGVPILMLKSGMSKYKIPRPRTNARAIGRAISSASSSSSGSASSGSRRSRSSSGSSSRSQASNYGMNGSNRNSNSMRGGSSGSSASSRGRINNNYKIANFQNLRAKKGKYRTNNDPRLAKMSRFSKGVKVRKVRAMASKTARRMSKTPYKMFKLPKLKSALASIPTSAAHLALGSRAKVTRAQLRMADTLRWKMYENAMKNKKWPNNKNKEQAFAEERSNLANKLMNVAIKKVLAGNVSPPRARSPKGPMGPRHFGSGYSANSNNNRNVKALIMKKFSKRRPQKLDIVRHFESGMIRGVQPDIETTRNSKEVRAEKREMKAMREIFNKVMANQAKKNRGGKSSSSSPNSPKFHVTKSGAIKPGPKPAPPPKSGGAMKSLRKK